MTATERTNLVRFKIAKDKIKSEISRIWKEWINLPNNPIIPKHMWREMEWSYYYRIETLVDVSYWLFDKTEFNQEIISQCALKYLTRGY